MLFRQCLAGLISLGFAGSAAAQDLRGFEQEAQRDMRASVGISIPFGGSRPDSARTQPRFDLQIETGDTDWHSRARSMTDPGVDSRRNLRRTQFSLTMEDQPRFLVNGIAPIELAALRAAQDTDQDGEPLGTGDGPNGGDDVDEPDAFDHVARVALFTGVLVATGVVAIVGAYALSDDSD